MKKILFLSALALIGFAQLGCDDGVTEIKEAPANTGVTFAQFSPTLGTDLVNNVDFFFGENTTQNPRLGFAALGTRMPTPVEGGTLFRVRAQPVANQPTPPDAVNSRVSLSPRVNHTAFLGNTEANNLQATAPVGLAIVQEDLSPATQGNTKVRFVHLAVGAPAVDVYLVPPTPGTPVILRNIAYGQTSGGPLPLTAGQASAPAQIAFNQIPAATYRVEVRVAGADPTSTPVLAVNGVNLTPRRNTGGSFEFFQAFTIVARGFLAPPATTTGRALGATVINHFDAFATAN